MAFAQSDYVFFDNLTIEGQTIEMLIKEKDNYYQVKLAKSSTDTISSIKLLKNYDFETFKNVLTNLLKHDNITKKSDLALNESQNLQLKNQYERLQKDLQKKEILTELYDKQSVEFAGQLKLKKEVTLNKLEQNENCRLPFWSRVLCVASIGSYCKCQLNENDQNQEQFVNKNQKTLIVKNASVRFFNNRLSTIAVHGTIDDKEYTLLNNDFSVPFRFINRNGSKLVFKVQNEDYYLEWNDLLDYNPDGAEFSYAVKNKNYELKPNQSIRVESRNLFDYFTGIIFSDFLGVNNGNNSLLMAEGRVIIPLAFRNSGKWTRVNYFESYLNTSILNGQSNEENFVEWNAPVENNGTLDFSKLQLFDFFKKRNIETGLNVGLLNFEWKNLSTNITFDYGVNFYRTRFKYNISESQSETYQLFSIGHGPKLKFDIKPQVNFGADLNVGLMRYSFNGFNNRLPIPNELNFRNDVLEGNMRYYDMFYIVSNYYTKTNSSETNGGLYFRLAGFIDLNTKELSPQIMVGYATNLTTFINKFNKKDETPKF